VKAILLSLMLLLLLLAGTAQAGFSEIVVGENGQVVMAWPLDLNGKRHTMKTRQCIESGLGGREICEAAWQDDYSLEASALQTDNLPQMDAKGRLKNTPCLAQYEAAMRAMEPYLYRATGFKVDSSGDVQTLWDAVKQSCWSQP
jgi:hypothetical protein